MYFVSIATLMLFSLILKETVSIIQFENAKRVLHPSGRHLMHMHLESANMYGNSTDLMYFYSNVYVGDFNNPSKQSLIVDTGSGLTCFPCQNYCSMCGRHINSYYPLDSSTTKTILSCKNEPCGCILDNKCEFSIHYGEGSSYTGFWVVDDVYFGENADKDDMQRFQFGCVTKETNLFFTQDADGIMGLTSGNGKIQPIYTHLYERGLVEHNEFTLCLGKNGGKFIIGGYDETLKVHPDLPVQWVKLLGTGRYLINVQSISVDKERISISPSKAMIDSGTTFTYLSQSQYDDIDKLISKLCNSDKYHCKGIREKPNCYKFTPENTKEGSGLKEFFESFPIINFQVSNDQVIKWFPSEYFYEERENLYCLTVDHFASDNTMVIGGSMMRQYMYIFDITNVQVGIVRSKCSNDPNMYVFDDPKYTQATNVDNQNQTVSNNTTSQNQTKPGNTTNESLNSSDTSIPPVPTNPSNSSTPSEPASLPEPSSPIVEPSAPITPASPKTIEPTNVQNSPPVSPSNSSSNPPSTVDKNFKNPNKTNIVENPEISNTHTCTNCQNPPDNSLQFYFFLVVLLSIICIVAAVICYKMKKTNPNRMMVFNDVDIQIEHKQVEPDRISAPGNE